VASAAGGLIRPGDSASAGIHEPDFTENFDEPMRMLAPTRPEVHSLAPIEWGRAIRTGNTQTAGFEAAENE